MCHNADSADAKIGPGLGGLFERGTLSSTGGPATREAVASQILSPVGTMPSFEGRLSPRETADVVAYIETL